MNLYIQSGAHAELVQLAQQGGMFGAIASQHRRGRAGVDAAVVKAAVQSLDLSDEAFETNFRDYEERVRKQGFFARLLHRFVAKDLKNSFRAQQQQMLAEIEGLDDSDVFGGDEAEVLDLHKSWHMLHYLFTGTAWEGPAPANLLLKGGRAVGEDAGYGPARIVDPKATAAFNAFLERLDVERLKEKLDLQEMARLEIYCADDPSDDGAIAELEDDLDEYFPALQAYVAAAAKRGEGLAIWMS